MSQILIQQYLNELSDLRRVSGTERESVVREAFKTLLKGWGRSRDLIFAPEYEYTTPAKDRRVVDGALLHALRVPLGYWEAKDIDDDIDAEIEKKFRRGYPQDNIIFDNSREAVLIQNREHVMRCGVEDVSSLEKLLGLFFAFERPEIADFRKAVEQFKTDLPAVLESLREMIGAAEKENAVFNKASIKFLKHAQATINPSVSPADVREMLIQHILTEDIFSQVFGESDFHRQNNVAMELYALENTFFTGGVKRKTLDALKPYYAAIRSAAALVSSHHEKQAFLKVIYENFYKVYDRKKADRLGVVYTPNEIVRFMIESADWLCQKHFGKRLIDKNVEILDPAAGTGTFIAELIEHFRGQKEKLKHKYLEELHANEVAILSYYVANLNIEATYAAVTNEYAEFPNLCFVDTLDNVAALGIHSGFQHELFGALAEENVERIRRQNRRKISVIIGNPPYNAWQENYNARNPNRAYRRVDDRVRETYGKEGSAQNQISLYDMYARFFRWASDRIADDGIIAFITNRNFIDKNAFDGFRKIVARDFVDIWLLDLGGDVRANPKISGTKHNVFGIQTGVAISFFVKRKGMTGAIVHYARRPETETAEEKLNFVGSKKISEVYFESVTPDRKHIWIDQTANDWDEHTPIASQQSKTAKSRKPDKAIFRLVSNGVKSQRDEWVFDRTRSALVEKTKFLIDVYEKARANADDPGRNAIKWDRELDRYRQKGIRKSFQPSSIVQAAYRPFTKRWFYFDRHFNGMTYQMPAMFREKSSNLLISFSDTGWRSQFMVLSADGPIDLHFGAAVDAYQAVSRYRHDDDGSRADNVTDWALKAFRGNYEKHKKLKRPITKDAIFHYVYGVLHDPVYREKYALNLKREFPRIPFYADFWRWADWGEALMKLHIGYEAAKPWGLKRIDTREEKEKKAGFAPKALLRADKEAGTIQLDSETQLSGVPREAWDYRLGNRSALEWILDQYKEKTPKDPTIRAKFNTYRFADHKETVIDLLQRVTRVSVETMKIVAAMKAAGR